MKTIWKSASSNGMAQTKTDDKVQLLVVLQAQQLDDERLTEKELG